MPEKHILGDAKHVHQTDSWGLGRRLGKCNTFHYFFWILLCTDGQKNIPIYIRLLCISQNDYLVKGTSNLSTNEFPELIAIMPNLANRLLKLNMFRITGQNSLNKLVPFEAAIQAVIYQVLSDRSKLISCFKEGCQGADLTLTFLIDDLLALFFC